MLINKLLEQKNITKYRLCKESGVPQTTISDICSGKTSIEKCSAETIFRIARVLDVSMESLIAPAVQQAEEEKRRPSFDLFKSNICHRVKDMGDIPFIIELLENDQIRKLYEKNWHLEAFYLLAMLDYLSRINNIPLCEEYDDLRCQRLRDPLYPSSILALDAVSPNARAKETYAEKAIPEFLRFNIIESEIRDVI